MRCSIGRISAAFSIILASTAWPPSPTRAQDLRIYAVLNARNPTRALTRTQVKNLFLGVQLFWHGTVPVQLFTRGAGDAAHVFFERVLELSPQRFESLWTGRQLAGQGVAPVSLASAADVAARIAKTPSGISFVNESEKASLPAGQLKLIAIP